LKDQKLVTNHFKGGESKLIASQSWILSLGDLVNKISDWNINFRIERLAIHLDQDKA